MTDMQIPRGGCINCGRPVRTWKDGQWLCWLCVRDERRATPKPDVLAYLDDLAAEAKPLTEAQRDTIRLAFANQRVRE